MKNVDDVARNVPLKHREKERESENYNVTRSAEYTR